MNLLSLFKKNNKKNKIKHELNITMSDKALTFSGLFNREHYYATELWLFSREDNRSYMLSSQVPSQKFEFQVELKDIMSVLSEYSTEEELLDFYFKIKRPISELSEKQLNSDKVHFTEENGIQYGEYYIRGGRFEHSYIDEMTFYYEGENFIIPYITTRGNLSLAFNREPSSPTKLQIDKVRRNRDTLFIEGKLFTRNSIIKDGKVILKGRENGLELSASTVYFHHKKEETTKKYGLNRYSYKANINLVNFNQRDILPEDIYDLYFELEQHDYLEKRLVRLGRPTYTARIFLKDYSILSDREVMVINPYYTFKQKNLSLEIYNYPLETFEYLKKMMRFPWYHRLKHKQEDVWLVGERTYKAQDTGYAFFKYMRTEHPEKNVYYVIDKNSPERANVEKFGNVLDYQSIDHIFHTLIARKVISSHHPDYLYPLRTATFKKKVKADKVFLQHGVMGTKNMVANYGKNAPAFDTDLFMVSSDFEKEMIVHDFGYDPDEVFVTGLSRFDSLFEKDVPKKRQVLIIPTWRDWIQTEEAFIESEYYERYKDLIHSDILKDLAKKHQFEIVFCLHPNMRQFSHYFQEDHVKVITQGEVDVQFLIKQSALMVTDYSSVGFDFGFLHKPIIYYQFDQRRFIGPKLSHLDLDNDLPGEIVDEQSDVERLIEEYAESDFEMKRLFKQRANKFIKYYDQNASERIYDVIEQYEPKRQLFNNATIQLIRQGIYNRFRKSKFYYPVMKTFYRVGSKVIPVDKKLILFESGVGRQFGDSPKNIYDEILRRDLDFKKVWVYNKQHRFNDLNTKRIKRLTPQYYYYLLRAGYWFNNQNFPTYIKKRPQTTYVQTWHGTPLKKMLYDIQEVQGRSDDYVERVGKAVKNWDYLISPSEYASKAFRSAFKYEGEILEVGYPRNDILFLDQDAKMLEQIKNRLQLPEGKKVVLYAPTFRDNKTKGKNKFLFDMQLDLEQMQEQLGEEYVLLLRTHVVVSNKLNIDENLAEFVIDVTKYPDMQELLLITDILITDYSSVMFDFANTKRPLLFFTYDLEQYKENIRGFYFDFEEEAPGPLLYDTDEVIDSILNIDVVQEEYEQKYDAFHKKYCHLDDGHASERVVDHIFDKE